MEWRLRRAGPPDAAALALVAGATFLEAFGDILDGVDIVAHCAINNGAEAFARWTADPDALAVLAEFVPGGAPIGYTLLTTPDLPIDLHDGDIQLSRIYTLLPAHGRGLGAALMTRAIDDARALGGRRLLLGVYGGNIRAQRFYAKQGFEMVGTRRFKVGATWHDDLVFARDL